MPDIDKDAVLARLGGIRGPDDDRDIVRRGMVSDIVIANGRVMFSITVPAERAKAYEPMRDAAETAVKTMPGVTGAMVVLTAEKKGGTAPPRRVRPPCRGRHRSSSPGMDTIIRHRERRRGKRANRRRPRCPASAPSSRWRAARAASASRRRR